MDMKNAEAFAAAESVADYEHGWSSDIETDFAPKGLTEDTVRFISAKKNEPQWMLDWRLKAFRMWQTMEAPDWAKLEIAPIDYQDAYYYAAPKAKPKLGSLDEVDPEILRVYEKLGIPIEEQKVLAGVEGARKVAVDAVFDSVSVATTFRAELERAGVIFRSISEAIRGLQRRDVRLHPRRCPLPDGAEHLFPHQCGKHRPVRTNADHRGQGQLRQLPRRLHRADAR
jgi:Fe-S cluster assembly protein SufB